ncbi:MAG: glycerol-3-phosphate dehydrogenase/oxidase [Candidatus Dadabacteria bacterium]|nr:MAG: glycerol-3-phosphate dehydrogenase/oxidase [Candidatus Dadabacteria bacterium]
MREEVFDLLVIGGGINGAAVARDGVLRGMSVALLERGDFAVGTSSRSSKLVHGGVRYLEQGDLALVLEACRERDLLRTRIAPHIVRAQPFVFPLYEEDGLSPLRLRAGLTLYDLLAGFRNVHAHRMLSREEVVRLEPALRREGLVGGARYYDCWTDDARLTLETALAARSGGAAVLNYAEVVALEKDSAGRLAAARVRDRLSGRTTRVRARVFVNTTGPWLDRVRRLDDPGAPPRLRLTKGVHLVLDRSQVGNRHAVVIRGPDRRVMFVIPWQNHTLAGTTDTFYEGDPAEVRADEEDVEYILAAVNRAFPEAAVGRRDIISTYAGLRPLVAPEDELDESEISREDAVFESPAGLISLGGGKLTTHRHVAERIVDLAAKRIGRRVGKCRTATVPLPGALGIVPGPALEQPPSSLEEHLRSRYGAVAPEVAARTRSRPDLKARLAEDLPDLCVEVVHAVDHEMAVKLADVMVRRLHVHLRSRRRREAAGRVAELMAERLGWDEETRERELSEYLGALGEDGTGSGGGGKA